MTKLSLLKYQYPEETYQHIYIQVLQKIIYLEGKKSQYFKLLSVFYKKGYTMKLLDQNVYNIMK